MMFEGTGVSAQISQKKHDCLCVIIDFQELQNMKALSWRTDCAVPIGILFKHCNDIITNRYSHDLKTILQ